MYTPHMLIWTITLVLNVSLCLLMLFKGHYRRYKILFLSLIYEIFAAPILQYIYRTYGIDSPSYDHAYHIKKFLTILFYFAIIWEGFRWRNRCIRVPSEIYLFLLLVVFLADRGQFFSVSGMIYNGLRYANLATLLWWTFCMRGNEFYERRDFRR